MAFTSIIKVGHGATVPKTGYLDEVVDDLNALWGQITVPATNNSGGTLANGDIVAFETGTASSVVTSTTVADPRVIGVAVVASGTVANTATVDVQIIGRLAVLNVTGTIALFDQLQVSGTAKRAQTGTKNSFAVALSTNPSGTGTVLAALRGPGAQNLQAVGASVKRTAVQSIPDTTPTVINWTVEEFDTDVIHDNSTNNSRLTCKTAGLYEVICQVTFDVNATGVRALAILNNGSSTPLLDVQAAITAATYNTVVAAHGQIQLAVNDYLEAQVRQTSTGALDVIQGTSLFSMVRLGA